MSTYESSMPFHKGLRRAILGSVAITVTWVGVGIALEPGHEDSTSSTKSHSSSLPPTADEHETPAFSKADPIDQVATYNEKNDQDKIPPGIVIGVIALGAAGMLEVSRFMRRFHEGGPSELEHAPVDQDRWDEQFDEIRKRYNK